MTFPHNSGVGGGGSGRHRRVMDPASAVPSPYGPAVDGPQAQREAATAVREMVDMLAFAEERWDPQAWAVAHGAALELVVLLSSIDPNTGALLASAATTLDQARTAFEHTYAASHEA